VQEKGCRAAREYVVMMKSTSESLVSLVSLASCEYAPSAAFMLRAIVDWVVISISETPKHLSDTDTLQRDMTFQNTCKKTFHTFTPYFSIGFIISLRTFLRRKMLQVKLSSHLITLDPFLMALMAMASQSISHLWPGLRYHASSSHTNLGGWNFEGNMSNECPDYYLEWPFIMLPGRMSLSKAIGGFLFYTAPESQVSQVSCPNSTVLYHYIHYLSAYLHVPLSWSPR
jgi:hypothetical protein